MTDNTDNSNLMNQKVQNQANNNDQSNNTNHNHNNHNNDNNNHNNNGTNSRSTQNQNNRDDRRHEERRQDDKRQPKGRFSWVKRLMQNRQGLPANNLRQANHSNANQQMQQNQHSHHNNQNHDARINVEDHELSRHDSNSSSSTTSSDSHTNSSMTNNNTPSINTQPHLRVEKGRSIASSGANIDEMLNNQNDINSIESNYTTDNISTIPLKSIISSQSTKSPSILSESHDQASLNASTAETSIAPSQNNNPNNTYANQLLTQHIPDRDNESVVTLASSTRRVRRRSIDTNCSTTGIAPASIMERLPVHPNNSSYTPSIRTSEPTSQIDHYDSTDLQSEDQKSSIRSEPSIKKDTRKDNKQERQDKASHNPERQDNDTPHDGNSENQSANSTTQNPGSNSMESSQPWGDGDNNPQKSLDPRNLDT